MTALYLAETGEFHCQCSQTSADLAQKRNPGKYIYFDYDPPMQWDAEAGIYIHAEPIDLSMLKPGGTI